jgi:asparagine synthase (glutamine-hydrolysing)
MTSHMRPRGPDAEGFWEGEGVTLGHRRLAILDLDARADQPMVSNDRRYTIIFNGEIYNFRELRQTLESEGVCFHTTSDTEVILAMFAREGEAMLPRLRGMFAFAIWDAHLGQLFLARDPYGIKPLYYVRTKDGLLFASQVKTLVASGLVSKELEPAALAGFYLWGSIPEPWTIYRNVFALAAGHSLRIRAGAIEDPICWCDISKHWRGQGNQLPTLELRERVRQAVTDSVRAHLVADVPVSVFLSGGIDSAAVAGLASGLGAQVEGITVGFEEFNGRHENEVPIAAAIAAHYGLSHHIRRFSRSEFAQDLPLIFDAMDQPSIDGVNTWFASKAAAERGYKVVLSGVGGDELFCGYSSFSRIPRTAALGQAIAGIPGTRAVMDAACAYFGKRASKPKLASLPTFMGSLHGAYFLTRCVFLPQELPALIGAEVAREGLTRLGGQPPGMKPTKARDGVTTVGLLESTCYLRNQLLRDSDWASMGHSLELRTPLVDETLTDTLAQFVSGFADGVGKQMLAQSPVRQLPEFVMNRPKSGFSIPMTQWLSSPTYKSKWEHTPLLSGPKTPWARRWARCVIEGTVGCA